MHVGAHIQQRTRGCWLIVRNDAARTALCDMPGDGPSQLTCTPIATVNQDLTSQGRELNFLWRCFNSNQFLILHKAQGF